MTMMAVQRVRQGLRALFAFSQPIDLDLAAQVLSPPLLALFRQMSRSEQLHSLNVHHDVLAQGATPRDLATAALLHDVGKSRYPIRIWQKTLVVLVRAGQPGLFQRWSQGSPNNIIQRPFVVNIHHPEWSAEMIREAGASEIAVWLVRNHADHSTEIASHPNADLLRRLQQADDAN